MRSALADGERRGARIGEGQERGKMSEHGTVRRYSVGGCRCDLCRKARTDANRRWYSNPKNAEKAKKSLKERRSADPEKFKAWARAHYERNREKILERNRVRAAANRERINARNRELYARRRLESGAAAEIRAPRKPEAKPNPAKAAPAKKRGWRESPSLLTWCPSCGSPVIDTREGRAGHAERTGCKGAKA